MAYTRAPRRDAFSMPLNPDARQLELLVERVLWSSPDSDFVIPACYDHESGREIVVKGEADIENGDLLRILDGRFVFDHRRGWSFQIHEVDVSADAHRDAVRDELARVGVELD